MPASPATGVSPGDKFNRLVEIMERLRAPDGCPWDRDQTLDTLRKYLVEETYEVLDAIERRDYPGLAEELGDLILQPVFQAQLANEAGHFSIADTLDAINEKLVRRHPHIFGDGEANTADEVKLKWDQIKEQEKKNKGEAAPQALLDTISRAQPALAEAQDITAKVAKVGFDWPSTQEVFDKLHEEIDELEQAMASGTEAERQDELGDLLFVVVNLARKLKLDAEISLRDANSKFRRRFALVESALAAKGNPLGTATLEEMEAEWQQAKIKLKSPSAR